MRSRRPLPRGIAVVDARAAAACDAAAIDAGIPARALMQRAGAAAAAIVASRAVDRLSQGVLVATGAGNNGGDGWVAAHALHAAGVRVRVVECEPARTPNACAERDVAVAAGVQVDTSDDALLRGSERIVIDALLGTGFAPGPLRGNIAAAVARLQMRSELGAMLVALDLPSGIDASTGADAGAVHCDLTITFGTIKRGHLVARAQCGHLVLVDIGLGVHGVPRNTQLATPEWFRASLPAIRADAHKGTRGKIAIFGGGAGMAGAAILAARGALRSGAGMVKCVVAPESVAAVQQAEPMALCAPWPVDDADMRRVAGDWADVVLIGPGLGSTGARDAVQRMLAGFSGPVVLDADALNAFAGDSEALRVLLGDRVALLTPHAAEFARLASVDVDSVLAGRFEMPATLAARCGAAVLLKGVPTVVAGTDGAMICVAQGTPILATGGSGDVLGGMAATLLASTRDARLSGALAAYAHGRAAEAVSARAVRGYTLDDVLAALAGVWSQEPPAPQPPILCELPAVGEVTA